MYTTDLADNVYLANEQPQQLKIASFKNNIYFTAGFLDYFLIEKIKKSWKAKMVRIALNNEI